MNDDDLEYILNISPDMSAVDDALANISKQVDITSKFVSDTLLAKLSAQTKEINALTGSMKQATSNANTGGTGGKSIDEVYRTIPIDRLAKILDMEEKRSKVLKDEYAMRRDTLRLQEADPTALREELELRQQIAVLDQESNILRMKESLELDPALLDKRVENEQKMTLLKQRQLVLQKQLEEKIGPKYAKEKLDLQLKLEDSQHRAMINELNNAKSLLAIQQRIANERELEETKEEVFQATERERRKTESPDILSKILKITLGETIGTALSGVMGNARDKKRSAPDVEDFMNAVRGKGQGGDTELAHVNKNEKDLLKSVGGSGRTNVNSGLKSFSSVGNNFKEWFGDSKVVDEKGLPKTVYHGTKGENFEEFRTVEGSGHFGAHFGSIQQAENFTSPLGAEGARIYPVNLSIKNPLRLKDLDTWHWSDIIPELKRKGIEIPPGVEEERNKFGKPSPEWDKKTLRDIIESAGYDGITYLNTREGVDEEGLYKYMKEKGKYHKDLTDEDYKAFGAEESYIALRPDQIRSTLSSSGRQGDTELAHVNKQEQALLKSVGGSGTVNPKTGLKEFAGGTAPTPQGMSKGNLLPGIGELIGNSIAPGVGGEIGKVLATAIPKAIALPAEMATKALSTFSHSLSELGGPLGPIGAGLDLVSAGFDTFSGAVKSIPILGEIAGPFLDALGKVPGIIKDITTTLVGFAAKASPGQFLMFQRALEDVQGVIGQSFLPVLELMRIGVRLFGDVLANILPSMSEVREALDPVREGLLEFGSAVREILTEVGPLIRIFFIANIKILIAVLSPLGNAFLYVTKGIAAFLRPLRELMAVLGVDTGLRSSVGAAANPAKIQGLQEYQEQLQTAAYAEPGNTMASVPGNVATISGTLFNILTILEGMSRSGIRSFIEGIVGGGPTSAAQAAARANTGALTTGS